MPKRNLNNKNNKNNHNHNQPPNKKRKLNNNNNNNNKQLKCVVCNGEVWCECNCGDHVVCRDHVNHDCEQMATIIDSLFTPATTQLKSPELIMNGININKLAKKPGKLTYFEFADVVKFNKNKFFSEFWKIISLKTYILLNLFLGILGYSGDASTQKKHIIRTMNNYKIKYEVIAFNGLPQNAKDLLKPKFSNLKAANFAKLTLIFVTGL